MSMTVKFVLRKITTTHFKIAAKIEILALPRNLIIVTNDKIFIHLNTKFKLLM